MRLIFTILLTCINLIGLAQPFTYSGFVRGANEQGLSNIPVTLWGRRTDPYDVSFPSYSTATAYNVGTAIPSSDDVTHGPFNIGFTFNFFGNNYTQFYVGSNGWIGFSPGQTTGYTAAYIPNAGSPRNVIMADWEDLFPGSANIFYSTIGTAPNRRLVVNFNAVPHYGCRSNLHTFQFVLYETTNIIDVNYLSKPLCAGNNSTAGLVNIDNTNVVPVGGRNASQWSVSNYSVRYTPSAAETTFSLKGTYLTNASGFFTMVPNLDAQSFQFEVRLENLTMPLLTQTEASYSVQLSQNMTTLNSKLYYQMDINNDNKVTVSDTWGIFGRMSNFFPIWSMSPNYRIFTQAQWDVIKNGTTNLKSTYPGVQSMTITPVNGGTGFTN
jgi:hypothetical protein